MTIEEDKRCSVNGHDRGPKGEQKEKGGRRNRRRKGEKKGGEAEKHRAEKNRKTTS